MISENYTYEQKWHHKEGEKSGFATLSSTCWYEVINKSDECIAVCFMESDAAMIAEVMNRG